MRTDPAATTFLVILAAATLTPILMRWTARAFPPRSRDPAEFESLRPRYNSLELASQLAAITGAVGLGALVYALRARNTPWFVGLVFGWLVLTPVLLIALATLPRGVTRWREFWRFYELKYGISLRLLAPVYTSLAVLGIISTAVLLFT
jgi:hypothetical protein